MVPSQNEAAAVAQFSRKEAADIARVERECAEYKHRTGRVCKAYQEYLRICRRLWGPATLRCTRARATACNAASLYIVRSKVCGESTSYTVANPARMWSVIAPK